MTIKKQLEELMRTMADESLPESAFKSCAYELYKSTIVLFENDEGLPDDVFNGLDGKSRTAIVCTIAKVMIDI